KGRSCWRSTRSLSCSRSGRRRRSMPPLTPGVNPSYDNTWMLLAVLLDDGQDIIKTPPAQRTQKQRDTLADFFLERYTEVITKEEYKQLKFDEHWKKVQQLEQEHPELSQAQTISQNPHPPWTHLLIRRDH